MRSLFEPRRYQLKKEAVSAVRRGHPWIYRNHLSTAAEGFRVGQWLMLVDSSNHVVGWGIYDPGGIISIRVLKVGETNPDTTFLRKRVKKALARRDELKKYSNAYRAIHGENDGFPGVVIDVYGDTLVLQTYTPAVDSLGRYLATVVASEINAKNIVWKTPSKRRVKREGLEVRVLRGTMPGAISFQEGKLTLSVDVSEGQKSGAFLDLRALRKYLAQSKFHGKRVLNLFSYTGTLGLACEVAGAKEIWNVDVSAGAHELAKKRHTKTVSKHRFITADIFDWFPKLSDSEKFDVIIVDPPQMASQTKQVEKALRAYKLLYRESLKHLSRGGVLIGCCCTARIPRSKFETELRRWLPGSMKFRKNLSPEDDHPVGFTEGDYLKILVYEQTKAG